MLRQLPLDGMRRHLRHTEETQTRRVKNENYYTEKYGISFIQADE